MNNTAVITGASSGIGEAYAAAYAKQGYDLLLIARSKDKLETLATALNKEHGINATSYPADLTQSTDLLELTQLLQNKPVSVLVNNAGVATIGPFIKREPQRLEEEVLLNINAVVQLTRAVLPGMTLRNTGTVINIASSTAFQPSPFWANYAATKSHVVSFTQALNDEVNGTGVFLQAVCPGPVDTGFENYASDGNLDAPKFIFISPETVVRDSLKDIKKKREISIPAAHHRLVMNAGRLLPTRVSRLALRLSGKRMFD